jgi:tetratricopeptide (TPR) repeat protein
MNLSPHKLRILLLGISVVTCPVRGLAEDPATTLSLLKEAGQSILAGDLQTAEAKLQSILATEPTEYHALNFLGVIRAQQHRETEAEALFQQVIAEKPEFAGVHVNLGLLYVQAKRDEDAASQFQEALRLDPSRSDARSALVSSLRTQARAAVRTGNFEKSLALLLRARKVSPHDPDVIFEFGMTALQMSLLPDAIQAFQDALAVRKNDPSLLYALGRAQIGLAEFPQAKASFEQFLQVRPDDASGHYAMGLVQQSLQQTADARLHFEKSVQLQPAQTESYFQLGLMGLDQKHLEDAAARFERVLARDPNHAGALFGLGRVAFEKRDYPNAVPLLQRSIASDASLRQAHYYLGLAYARLGRKEDSEKELQTASSLEHQEVENHRIVLKILDSKDALRSGSGEQNENSSDDRPK